jgi:hypothetical protein
MLLPIGGGGYMNDLIEILRSMGFGALFGGGVVGLCYIMFPQQFPGAVELKNAILIGGLLGSGAHQLIDAWLVQSLLRPAGRTISFYSRLVQLILLRPIVGRQMHRELVRELVRDHFVGGPQAQLPEAGPSGKP